LTRRIVLRRQSSRHGAKVTEWRFEAKLNFLLLLNTLVHKHLSPTQSLFGNETIESDEPLLPQERSLVGDEY
jgi:hypothetical protein